MSEGARKEDALATVEAKEKKAATRAKIDEMKKAKADAALLVHEEATAAELEAASKRRADRMEDHKFHAEEAASAARGKSQEREAAEAERAEQDSQSEARRAEKEEIKAAQRATAQEAAYAKAEAVSPRSKRDAPLTRKELMPSIMEIYEAVDSADTGFAPKEEVLDELQKKFGTDAVVGEFVATIREGGTVILDRESFENSLMEWVKKE